MSSYQNNNRNVGGTKPSPGKPGTTKIPDTACYNSTAESSNCYKTPNKSGLTPVRPKSDNKQSGTKLKSGLTPTRPGVDRNIGKSPFPGSKQKLKSGLQPIRPTDGKQQTSSSLDFDNSSFANRRKSGLKPMKPGGMFSNSNLNNSVMTSGYNSSSAFLAPASKPSNNFDFVPPSATRRKSGLVPTKSRMSIGQGHLASVQRQPQWQPKVAPIREFSRIPSSNPSSRLNSHVKGSIDSLNNIQEGEESPRNSRNDVSGIRSLDETLEMSVVLRPRASHQGVFTRFPQPGCNLSTYDTSKSRIPKRVLHFDEEDELTVTNNARINANVLKDGSSRINIVEEVKNSNHSLNEPSNHQEALLQRKKVIESEMQKMAIELEKVNQQLSQLMCKKTQEESENPSANSSLAGTSEAGQDDSPFAHVPSPLSADPLELLPLENSKQPENIYKVFRQSCSFLKTPQASAFRKQPGKRMSAMHGVDETPNISRRLQKQLADLFDE